ncbi:hypothetical protein D9615_008064 [Tricholomella constricta]|uniref:Uncharacterized protein n=1 Tax=Tricholomella constricta TaxID=117010 RepID=A0A8H5LWH8_9AGAR|nr:hypothetical protein D9615_008064 [Tricholomella constricta]
MLGPLIVLTGIAYAAARSLSAILEISQISPALDGLSVRQSLPNVPQQCKADCDPVNTIIANQCAPKECCTATFETQYYNCLLCVGNSLNITDYTAPQDTLDLFQQQCARNGLPIPTLTLPGQGASSGASAPPNPAPTSTRPGPTPTSRSGTSSTTPLPTLPVPSPPISQQTITALSTSDQATGAPADPTNGPPNDNNSGSREYGVSCFTVGFVSFILAAWQLQ